MAIENLLEHKEKLEELLFSTKKRQHFTSCDRALILQIVSICHNIALGTVELTSEEREIVHPYRSFICTLGNIDKTNITEKVEYLNANIAKSLRILRFLYKIVFEKVEENKLQ